MKRIDTKNKRDIGLTQIIADLTKKDVKIALPISEHLPFDLIAISPDNRLSRVSIKYSGGDEKAVISLRTISSNSKGYNVKYVNFDDVDAFAVYSPITGECYYVNKNQIKSKNAFSIRISGEVKSKFGVKFAKDFLDFNVLWSDNRTSVPELT